MACLAGTIATVPTPQHSASTDSGVEQHHSTEAQSDVEPSASVDESGEGGLVCPTECSLVLSKTREFSDNMGDHNPARSSDGSAGEEDCSCRVCGKILSSASSLDRHVLVHTGERPFKCGLCGSGFTTNGNMHRHIRAAHGSSPSTSCTDSEGSSDSERPELKHRRVEEFNNNNNINKRKSPDFLDDEPPDDMRKRKRMIHNNSREESKNCLLEAQPTPHTCPVCGKVNFSTSAVLEAHLEQNHPEYPAKCDTCNLNFKDHRVLSRHRTMGHHSERSMNSPTRTLRNSVIGFDDLTYVDFSAAKFPAIARAACEKSRHRPALGEVAIFECCKCRIAFPCRTALDSHESDCGNQSSQSTSVTDESASGRDDLASGRDDFFARLDLQNKAALTEAREGKDLADIQSIISVTSGPILQNFSRSDASTPENIVKVCSSVGSSGSSGGTISAENHEEEVQDAFSAEFRRMKLRGEFPCRLCDAVFPNLRALKGHNRAHIGADSKMPYPCNMCPFVSTDKAALTRHLRSHNGDRPYECSLCNYAFTTKANCERHLRNRHAKITREDVKRSIIYHPSEDPLNDSSEASPRVGVRDDNRRSIMFSNDRDESSQHRSSFGGVDTKREARTLNDESSRQSELTPGHEMQLKTYEKPDIFHGPPLVRNLEMMQRHSVVPLTDMDGSRNLTIKPSYSKHSDDQDDNNSTDDSVSLVNETKQEMHQRQDIPMDLKTSPSPDSSGEEAPLDLSMDALDLSKKSKPRDSRDSLDSVNSRQDFHKNNKDFYDARNQLLLTQVLMKAGQHPQPTTLETLYNANLLYHNFGSFPTGIGAAGLISPYLFNPHLLGQDFSMQKELVRERQLHSGGVMVKPQAAAAAAVATAFEATLSRNKDASYHSNSEDNDYAPKMMSPKLPSSKITNSRDKDNLASSNSVKMVIKNGVLMPKQKQRRYRTERPFACEHCSARFTLRSNMERHVKQQHPQHWSQRQRGGHSTRGRPPANPPTLLQNFNQSVTQPLSQHRANILPKLEQASTPDYGKNIIPDQVKYAILAHQLKGNKAEEVESEEELVIDEEPAEEDAEGSSQEPNEDEKPLSLLRDKLEDRTALSKDVIMKQHVNEFSKEYLVKLREQHLERLKRYETTKTLDAHHDDEVPENNIKKEIVDEDASGTTSTKETDTREEKEKSEDGGVDLASVSRLLDNASQQYQQFQPQYLSDDEEGLIASTSEGNNSGSDEKSDSGNSESVPGKKKSAYSLAPNRVSCPYCHRKFPWTSSLRRHILTHTGQKPYKCTYCPLLFTTKSNCDRHLLRKHVNNTTNTMSQAHSSAAAVLSSPETSNALLNSNAFAMRNVPERPYKCNQCPSSTFSTLGNLKKHLSSKHSSGGPYSRSHSPSSEPQNSPQGSSKQNDQTGYDSPSSSLEETVRSSPGIDENHKSTPHTSPSVDTTQSVKTSPECGSTVSSCSSELPFKCHLCDGSFAERQDCLEHIKDDHRAEYELLVTKGALDMAAETETHPEEQQQSSQQHCDDGEGQRGKFPDYANRKVVCAFCMRRFWSAEDLRRHMRTHTGERPFSCDICRRRFTLKHSMLRHRKKHGSIGSAIYTGTSGDEEMSPLMPSINNNHINSNNNTSKGQDRATGISSSAGGDPTLVRFGAHEKLNSISGKPTAVRNNSNANNHHEGGEDNNDLITNLLGLNDKTIVDRVLQSPDDAAKLLGVQRGQD